MVIENREGFQTHEKGKKLYLEHFIFTHSGMEDYITLRSKLFDETSNGLLSSVLQHTSFGSYDLWHDGKSVQKKSIYNNFHHPLDSKFNLYVFAEGALDSYCRHAVHKHFVLVPKDVKISPEQIPYIDSKKLRELHIKYTDEALRNAIINSDCAGLRKKGTNEHLAAWQPLYEARKQSMPPLEITLESE